MNQPAIVPAGAKPLDPVAAATALARALNRLLSATVDADLADGLGLSIGAAGAREQALDALATWEISRG